MERQVEGRLEAVLDGRAVGWAWDPGRPGEPIEVEIVVDEEPVARGLADVSRPSLSAEGIGDGRHGFDIPLPEALAGSPAHTIKATAGTEAAELPPVNGFETIVEGEGPWRRSRFAPAAPGRLPFVPEPEDPPDPGAAALIGKHGWLFPWDKSRLGEEQLQGAPLLSEEAVNHHREAVTRRWLQLRELGIPYLYAVVPLKERVYRKFLPPGLFLHEQRPVGQLDRALRAAGSFEALDLLPALREARHRGRAFPRTGSGWSDLGAFFAYRELMREAAKRVLDLSDPPPPEDTLFAAGAIRGDLADKPKLSFSAGRFAPATGDGDLEEEIDVLDVSRLRALRMPAPRHLEATPGRAPHLYEIDAEMPRAVLVGDESCLALVPWLAEHFRRFVFLFADEPPLEAIELEMPDLVIQVVSESRLLREP